jgi:molecular chaperone GrpE
VTAADQPVEGLTQEAADTSAASAGPGADPVAEQPDAAGELQHQLAERTLDLQRLQAEYVNYKRRVDRDRDRVRDDARAGVLSAMVAVLDDIERARTHGELTGGFKAVAESLQRTLAGLGLDRYGEPGDPFDPRVHEALTHGYDDTVEQPTAQTILQPGYRIGERILRPAMVGVVEPSVVVAGGTDETGAAEQALLDEPPTADHSSQPPASEPVAGTAPAADQLAPEQPEQPVPPVQQTASQVTQGDQAEL